MRGCGCILAFVVACFSLNACSSDEASFEVQYKSDIKKVLEILSNAEPFRLDVAPLPVSNKLTHEHVIMYVRVKASAMQLVLEEYALTQQAASSSAGDEQMVKTSNNSGEESPSPSGNYGPVSSMERKVLEQLSYSLETYTRTRDILDVTLDFIDVVDSPEVVELVSKHDPAIKENLSLVEDVKDLLETVNRYPIDRFIRRPLPSQRT